MVCTNVNFLVLIMYYSYARGYHWGKLGKWYTGSLCTFFATSCKSIIISKILDGYFFKIDLLFIYLFYLFLAASGLSCGTQYLSLRRTGFSLVVACGSSLVVVHRLQGAGAL